MNFILVNLIALMPSIIGPVICMILLKTNFLKSLNKPIDGNVVLNDGKRLFGDNKTVRGFIIYVIATSIFSVLWGILCKRIPYLGNNNSLYFNYENTAIFNLIVGILYGVAYALFELPNSFIKRRLDINNENFKQIKGIKKYMSRCYDFIDSAIGCILILHIFNRLTFFEYMILVLTGGVIHWAIVVILYKMKIKKQV